MTHRVKSVFFYEGGGRSKVLNQIHHCVRFNPGVIALTGPTGCGRSLLIQALVSSFGGDEIDFCLLSEESAVLETEEELFRALADGFDLEEKPIEILEDLVDRVRHSIQVGLSSKCIMLIIVDDIQQHSDEVLEALLHLASSIKGVSLLLSGEQSLIDKLKQYHLHSVLIHQITLRPLLTEETHDFLHQYLQQQGISGDSLLNRKKLDELMGKTGGNLSLLVREAQHLVSGNSVKSGYLPANIPIAHLVSLIMVVTITTLVFLFYPTSNQVVRDTALTLQTPDTSMQVAAVKTVLTSPPTDFKQKKTTESEAIVTERQEESKLSLNMSKPISEPSRNPSNYNLPVKLIYSHQEQELLNRPAGNLTLQVLSLSSEKMVKTFIDQLSSTDKSALSYYRRGTEDKQSYVVLYGDYPDKRQAVEAQNKLPPALKKSTPWPRPIADIQRELRQRQP